MSTLTLVVSDSDGNTTAESYGYNDPVDAAQFVIKRAAALYSTGGSIVSFDWSPQTN